METFAGDQWTVGDTCVNTGAGGTNTGTDISTGAGVAIGLSVVAVMVLAGCLVMAAALVLVCKRNKKPPKGIYYVYHHS